MHADFSCDRCGELVPNDQPPGSIVRCKACGKKLAVPAPARGDSRRIAVQCADPPPQEVGVLRPFAPHDEPPEGLAARAMPWVVSLFFHAGLMLIMAFLTLFVAKTEGPVVHRPGEVGPLVESVPLRIVDGRKDDDGTRKTAAPKHEYTKRPDNLHTTAAPADRPIERLIGTGGRASGGSLSPFRPGTGTGMFDIGPEGRPATTTARNLVFVIDKSGSMIDTFDIVRMELLKKIGYLTTEHRFCVVFFSDGRLLETPPGGLVRASDDNKLAAAAFLADIRPAGQTDAVPALERAFGVLAQADARRGNQIYLLTDGVFPDNQKVLDLIARRNRRKEVMINTYLFGYRSPLAMEVLQKIARDSGSQFRYVDPADVGAER